jgi:regulator of replication initiation timing
MSGQAGDTGECPDRERALTTQIADLQQKLARLTLENARLTQERDNLNVELLNVKASQEGPTDPNDPDENQDISSDAARKRLFRMMKRGADGQLASS